MRALIDGLMSTYASAGCWWRLIFSGDQVRSELTVMILVVVITVEIVESVEIVETVETVETVEMVESVNVPLIPLMQTNTQID